MKSVYLSKEGIPSPPWKLGMLCTEVFLACIYENKNNRDKAVNSSETLSYNQRKFSIVCLKHKCGGLYVLCK